MSKIAIGVTLSGNAKPYMYTCDTAELFSRTPGVDRVVIPNKVKEDGTLSLSIGTFIGADATASTEDLKPIVQFLDPDKVRVAQVEVLRLEAAGKEA